MPSSDPLVTDLLDHEESAQLSSITVPVAHGRSIDLRTLLGAWERHVRKIEDDLDRPDSDRTVWGAYDLVAALRLRSLIRDGLRALPPTLLNSVEGLLAAIDNRFRSYTEEDVGGTVRAIDDAEVSPQEWWWRRIPVRGPVRRELERFAAGIEPEDPAGK